jgi:CBS-domain-containing membrane protein
MATLSPLVVSDTVPQFNVMRERRFEGGSTSRIEQCSQDETTALAELRTEWVRFGRTDQETCMGETKIGGFASYVELLTCLEMTRDVVSANASPQQPRANSGSPPTRPDQIDVKRNRH